jgi:hypothetical protein
MTYMGKRAFAALAMTIGLTTSLLAAGAGSATAATTTVETGHGAGFSTSWVERGTTDTAREVGLRGNAHVGFLQTFKNVGKPLFVDGVIRDLRCQPGQNPLEDECREVAFHTIKAVKDGARLTVADRLRSGRLVGLVRIVHEDGTSRKVRVDLQLTRDGSLKPHHYLDEYVDEEFSRRYEEIGRERAALAYGVLAGSKVRKAESLLYRFRWTDSKTTS